MHNEQVIGQKKVHLHIGFPSLTRATLPLAKKIATKVRFCDCVTQNKEVKILIFSPGDVDGKISTNYETYYKM